MTNDYENEMQKFEAMEKSFEVDSKKQEIELREAIYLKDRYEHKCGELYLGIEKLKNELQIERDRANALELVASKPCKDCEYSKNKASI